MEVTVSLKSFEKTEYCWLDLVSADTTKTKRDMFSVKYNRFS